MDHRAFAFGLLGWVVPGIVAVPLVGTNESAGGEAALGILFVWWGLGVVGCAVGGAAAAVLGGKSGRPAHAFKSGLAGVSVAWVGAFAAEVAVNMFVRVLHLGGLSILLPIPFILGYGVGFALCAVLFRPGASQESGSPGSAADGDSVGEVFAHVRERSGKDRH
jgi:hypothetical protein